MSNDKKRTFAPSYLKGSTLSIFFFLFFTFLAIVTFFQDVLSMKLRDRPNDWQYSLIFTNEWFLWAAITPLIIYLARRFPIRKENLLRNLLLHFSFSVLLVAIHLIIHTYLSWYLDSITLKHGHDLSWYFINFIYSVQLYFIFYFITIGVVQALDILWKYQQSKIQTAQLQSQLVQSQLQALKMQLHPHFLFNTHHAIVGLMLRNENERAINMLTRLSDLLRMTLDKNDEQLTDLKSELEFLSLYLEIQQERFQDRLKISINVPNEVMNAEVPAFILQPIVENALQHGIAPNAGAGLLEIRAERKNGNLELQVRDDGAGVNGIVQEGIGLKNTKSRLEQLYHDEFYFVLKNDDRKGSVALLSFPFKVAEQKLNQ